MVVSRCSWVAERGKKWILKCLLLAGLTIVDIIEVWLAWNLVIIENKRNGHRIFVVAHFSSLVISLLATS